MRSLLWMLLGAVAALGFGTLLGNYVLMPRLVEHGKTVEVPAIVGMALGDARRTCAAAGLQLVEDDREHSATLPPLHVISQSPAARSPVKRGRGVRVVVSLGEERVAVPDLRRKSLRQATLDLQNAQLVLGPVSRVPGTGGAGLVQATSPHAGSEAAMGDSVAVLVTSGEFPEAYLMPNLTGQELGDVRALIESRGFRLGDVSYRDVHDVLPGTVLEQSPARGARIRRGEAIDLVVANPE